MAKNLLVLHGGGPTAVINSSLYGVIKQAKKSPEIDRIYAAKNGTGGLLREEFIDLTDLDDSTIEHLKQTPGTAIGTSRDPLEREDYEKMVDILVKHNIQYVLCNGGNGTMDTCGKLYEMCQEKGLSIRVIGIPKTMDNDLSVTDHSPGFASAAQYIAQSVREVCYDVASLPIHVVVIEASGRNAGWITAASALADIEGPYKPDLIYLPEVPFSQTQFLEDVRNLLQHKKGIVVVASEGLKDSEGKPIVAPIFTVGRATYFGDVSAHLANLIIKELGYKARGEKPGLLGRASITMQSPLDVAEAILVGEQAVEAVIAGETGKMVALMRQESEDYQVETQLVPIKDVMLYEKTMPRHFINPSGNGVTPAFIEWCQPFVQAMPEMISFK
ncbi:MAG: 6-phosphofructokinase [Aerococcaceae bacterium]|nr:6-phosphofructokinase [Aerococcaceae bacterium]